LTTSKTATFPAKAHGLGMGTMPDAVA
jgi:hypothetical protein